MKVRIKRHVRRPPDLTSLFDVLFIVVFVALIRAAAAQHELERGPPTAVRPASPVVPAAVAALRARALADLDADLRSRAPLVMRISAAAAIEAIELDGHRIPLDVPLLEPSPDPDVAVTYLGDRSADLRLCRLAVLHLQVPNLAHHLIIVAPAVPLADLPHALFEGLHRDLDRCLSEQGGVATLVDPAALAPTPPPPQEPTP